MFLLTFTKVFLFKIPAFFDPPRLAFDFLFRPDYSPYTFSRQALSTTCQH
jgi:hypothetical protein